ncbi:MAG: hypothetical protein DMG52_06625 [Acidobacteria bacterium]|nr:MAG: hypothetical protein DMG55_22800 [Acidobacteriota bacterium]PYU75702.1 MAG: hypothetical protein DMG52_06625 [Acidobacteriota bacterium]
MHYLCKELCTLCKSLSLTKAFLQKKQDLDDGKFGQPHAPTHSDGIQMSMNGQERVAEDRAAVLLGLTTTEIRSFSRISGLGHLECGDRGEQMVFTYDELQRLCLLAAQSSK